MEYQLWVIMGNLNTKKSLTYLPLIYEMLIFNLHCVEVRSELFYILCTQNTSESN
jgi:hypothetical protein